MERLDPEIEIKHARNHRQRVKSEASQRRRERQAMHQSEAAGDEDLPASKDGDQGMYGRN
jgi:hypothetical protein